MADSAREQLIVSNQLAILVCVVSSDEKVYKDRALQEIRGLAETAGAKVVGELTQVRERPDAATYIGKGKVEELKQLIEALGAEIIIFDGHLSPAQGKSLEEETGKQVVDRSEVILDIFATHARTHESRLQVELAQLLYMRPRLTRMWTHLERIEGGIGIGRGPGEKQLETDRRLVDQPDRRTADASSKKSRNAAERQVAVRRDHLTVSLVGYTNAGKSTLMNALTGADVYVADKLFATLDTRTPQVDAAALGRRAAQRHRRVHPQPAAPPRRLVPVDARRSPARRPAAARRRRQPSRMRTVRSKPSKKCSRKLGVDSHEPILVLNKIDAVEDRSFVDVLRAKFPRSVAVSAFKKQGLDLLASAVAARLGDGFIDASISADVGNGKLFAYLSEHSELFETTYEENRVRYRCRVPRRFFNGISGADVKIELIEQDHPPAVIGD